MDNLFNIAAYCRISVDLELDRENTSIENQKSIIQDFVARKFPSATLTFYEDRDKSGYTFEQRDGYQKMRSKLMSGEHEILIVKDFSRFARRNSKGLVELEDLRDAGVRIISIGDNIDYPTYDDWQQIQFRFLINEMPVTDTSKKVRNVINRRQSEGRWICSVPYGYIITNSKKMIYEPDPEAAEIVQMVFKLYNDGWGYKKIANHLTDLKIPTPRARERDRKIASGEETKIKCKSAWSIVTVQGILTNDFYIGTLRQRKYTRKRINGDDKKLADENHIVFENYHEPIVDYKTFALTKELMAKRTASNYRGVKKYANDYSGLLRCGDCGSPMFSMSRSDLAPAYRCGAYHQRGLKGCTSHHVRTELLDTLVKSYLTRIRSNAMEMVSQLTDAIRQEKNNTAQSESLLEQLERQHFETKEELKALARQKIRDTAKNPEKQDLYDELYSELEQDLTNKLEGISNQIAMTVNRQNTLIRTNRTAKTALEIFDDILEKDKLDRRDLELILDEILVYEDHIEIKLKRDIDTLLKLGTTEDAANFNFGDRNSLQITSSVPRHKDKVLIVNVINSGDPLEIYTEKDGEVIFKKYSPIGELGDFASSYAETLAKTCGKGACITDRDSVIAVSGVPKKELMEKRVSSDLENVMSEKTPFQSQGFDSGIAIAEGVDKYNAGVVVPIVSEGDTIGSVIFILNDGEQVSEVESKLAESAAGFLGRHIEG